MEPSRSTEAGATPAVADTVTDALTDQVAAEFIGEQPVPVEPTAESIEQIGRAHV